MEDWQRVPEVESLALEKAHLAINQLVWLRDTAVHSSDPRVAEMGTLIAAGLDFAKELGWEVVFKVIPYVPPQKETNQDG